MSELPRASRDINTPRDGGQDVYHRRPSAISNLEPRGSTASSDANQPVPRNVASIFSQLAPDWEIEERTHLPLHLTNCKQCFQFASHITDFTRGGAISMLVSLQREHWHKNLEDESRKRENEAYSAGLDKNQYKVERLEDEIDDCHNCLKALKSENEVITLPPPFVIKSCRIPTIPIGIL